ncbi:hypothetical protein ACWDU0_05360 [Streptomyces cellulosae]
MSSQAVTTVALLADPDAPTEIAHRVAQKLPERLSERAGDGREFDVHVVSEPFTAGAEDPASLRRRVLERGREEDWDVVVALTDLPLHAHGRKLAVDLDHEHGMAVLSLPSLGGLGFQRRARRAVEDAVLNLTQAHAAGAGGTPRREPLLTFVGRLAPIHRSRTDDEEAVDLRYVVTGPRGYLRLLLGMVRANRPWRLVPGLSKVLATALATGAIATVNATVWSLAGTLSTVRLVIATVGSIVLMVGWLIVDAGLWQRTTDASPEARQRDALYNASTVVTLGLGVLVCYVGLVAVNLLWALFILNDRVYASVTRTPLDGGQYWTLAWFVASVATVGGALGSSLESDEAIRTAAYSKREQERLRMLRDEREGHER